MKKIKLIPPDKKRCQAMLKEGCHPDAQHFMILGPGRFVRCDNKPAAIAHENQPRDDGLKGSMSLCETCLNNFLKAFGKDYATIKNYERTNSRGLDICQRVRL